MEELILQVVGRKSENVAAARLVTDDQHIPTSDVMNQMWPTSGDSVAVFVKSAKL